MFQLILFFFFVGLIESCTYTPSEWLNHKNLIQENQTICRVKWLQILEINVAHMKIQENQLWVVVAQQYIASRLNQLRVPPEDEDPLNITQCLLYLGNSLEYYCSNISQWRLGEKEEASLRVLDDFNHGVLEKYPACDSVHILPASDENETHFYYQSIDTFIVRDYDQNQTISRSEFLGLINTNTIISISLGFAALWLLICFLKMVIDANAKKRYRFWKWKNSHSTSPSKPQERDDVHIELSSDDGDQPLEI